MFRKSTAEHEWHGLTGGEQYRNYYNFNRRQSPAATRIDELLALMYDWSLDYYIHRAVREWNRTFVPDYNDEENRLILIYDKDAISHGAEQETEYKQARKKTPADRSGASQGRNRRGRAVATGAEPTRAVTSGADASSSSTGNAALTRRAADGRDGKRHPVSELAADGERAYGYVPMDNPAHCLAT